jgi:hypothetical protein
MTARPCSPAHRVRHQPDWRRHLPGARETASTPGFDLALTIGKTNGSSGIYASAAVALHLGKADLTDLATPCAGGGAAFFDEFLKALQVALHTP